MARRVVMLAFPGTQVLDVAGPLEVFATAARLASEARRLTGEPVYRTEVAALARGPLRTSGGIVVSADRALRDVRGGVDTLIVAGGPGVAAACREDALLRRLRDLAPRVRRLASVCTGAFLLAEAGLLDGRRVTTHWASCGELARRYPRLRVESDPIFVRDGSVYTSAGVTAGMDLALALVEEDLGRAVALSAARRLVLFLKRPGGQSQFSAWLRAQDAERGPIEELSTWIVENPARDLSVAALARRAGMSPRHFARVFAASSGSTPARFVERARVESARRLLEDSGRSIDQVAEGSGFGSAETMRRAFLRSLGVGPADYRRRFRSAESTGLEAART